MPIYIRSSFSTLGTLSARSEGAEQIGSTVHSSILWSYRDESDLPVFTEMYQFNLAKDLKEHKTFPLNLKFTTDLRSLTEVFSSGRLVVLFHVSETIGLSDLGQLSLLTLKLLYHPDMLLDMIIPFKWITSLLSRRQT